MHDEYNTSWKYISNRYMFIYSSAIRIIIIHLCWEINELILNEAIQKDGSKRLSLCLLLFSKQLHITMLFLRNVKCFKNVQTRWEDKVDSTILCIQITAMTDLSAHDYIKPSQSQGSRVETKLMGVAHWMTMRISLQPWARN